MGTLAGKIRPPAGLCFVVAFGAVMLARNSVAAALPPLPAMACPVISAEDAPRIDGALDEPAWSHADVQTQFHRRHGGLNRPQEFRLLSDGQWLYVGVTAYEQGISEKDLETVGVFIAPHKASDQFVKFYVTMNAKGITKSQPPLPEGKGGDWRAAFRQHEDRWEAEIAIRAAPVFGGELGKGKVFDFNLSRTRAEVAGDSFDVGQQWSNTGLSENTRYRFGQVTIGSPADRLPAIRSNLQRELELARGEVGGLSAESRQVFSQAEQEVEALLAASPGEGVLTSAAAQEYQRQAGALERRLQRAVLAERGIIVWACNPMTTPMPEDLPSVNQHDAARIDVRVLAGEWESAALVVTNLTEGILDGRVTLKDFISADGKARVPGWDVLQVRTAPPIVLEAGRKRDPLPLLQEGGLFRVSPDQNELLWLTFKSRDIAPGRYNSTLTARSLDGRLFREVELVLRVYPLALGAEGRPAVHVWNHLVRGKDWAERVANCRDYYINAFQAHYQWHLPHFTADADGNIGDSNLDFWAWDDGFDEYMKSGVHTYLLTMSSRTGYFWPAKRADGSTSFNFERWSPKFNDIFAKWVAAFRENMASKGLPPDRWAFYIMDEPAPGENRQEVTSFARVLRQVDPDLRTYVTLGIGSGDDAENLELSKYVHTVQTIGTAKPEVMAQVRANVKRFWTYRILNRNSSPFSSYRKDACWQSLKDGYTGTGFWVWDYSDPDIDFLWQVEGNALFPAIYNDHDGTIIPSLRTEAFREGIEDWKYVLMLDDAIARARTSGVAKSIVDKAAAFRAKCLAELKDADSVEPFRTRAREQLLALHAALGEVDPSTVKAIDED
jgi:hypothetical protein